MKTFYLILVICLSIFGLKTLNKNNNDSVVKKQPILIFSKLYEKKEDNNKKVAKINISSF